MHTLIRVLLSAVVALGFIGAAAAQEHGTKAEAEAMAQAAMAHVKKVGAEQAFKDFTEDKANWSKKDLYVFAIGHDGLCLGHGANAKLVGKNLIGLKDAAGKEFVKELVATSKGSGTGWVDYDWAHPQTKKVEGKTSYVVRLAGFDGLVGVGVYR